MLVKKKVLSFEWDKGNLDKGYAKHGIEPKQTEEVFVDNESIVLPDVRHSQREDRFIIVGRTLSKIYLFIVFTFRGNKVRVISARKMHQKEVEKYKRSLKLTL